MLEVFHVDYDRIPAEKMLWVIMGRPKDTHVRLCAELWSAGVYDKVATLYAPTLELGELEHAFRQTNSAEYEWYGPQRQTAVVTPHFKSGEGALRSTSVGDVMRLGDKWYVVGSSGFEELTPHIAPPAESIQA